MFGSPTMCRGNGDHPIRCLVKGPAFALSEELVDTINWWVNTLPIANPRTIQLRPACPVSIYSDAEGSGHVAAVVFYRLPKPVSVCHTHCPGWMLGPTNVQCRHFRIRIAGSGPGRVSGRIPVPRPAPLGVL